MGKRAFDGAPHFGHAPEEGKRPARREDVELEAGVAGMQELQQGLRLHHVADPGWSDDEDFHKDEG